MQIKPICTAQPCFIWSWGWFQEAALILGLHNQMHCLVLEWSQSVLKGLCHIPPKAREKSIQGKKVWSELHLQVQNKDILKKITCTLLRADTELRGTEEKNQNEFQIKCGRNNLCVSVGKRGECESLNFRSATVVIQAPPSGSACCPLPSTGHKSQMLHLLL